MQTEKMIFIINPRAGNWLNQIQRCKLMKQIRDSFGNVKIVFSEEKGENSISDLARSAQRSGFNKIIVRGGDGSLNQVLNGVDLPDPFLSVGVIPAGTGNDIASTLGIPWKIAKAFAVIKEGHTRQIDLGIVNGILFANTISIGLDALVNQRATILKPFFQRLGLSFLSYALAILLVMFRKENDPVVFFEIDSEKITRKIGFAAITNCYRYGRGFNINPPAEVDDGWLNMCILNPVASLAFPYYGWRTKSGTHVSMERKFSFHEFKKLKITSSFPVISQIDGEVQECSRRYEISVLPRVLRIIVPKG
ncbi:MAG: diacylglycerol kinase family protein [Patescibacteria group bacterium]|nr:diacylglycerol kinase family protein [Patescibacteria group bacterium]